MKEFKQATGIYKGRTLPVISIRLYDECARDKVENSGIVTDSIIVVQVNNYDPSEGSITSYYKFVVIDEEVTFVE